jgi:SanA protein
MKIKRIVFIICITLFILFSLQLFLIIKYERNIYRSLTAVPSSEFGVVLGAYVFDDQSLSDAARERVEAGILLYKSGKVRTLFISGTNRDNFQADAMANYAIDHGVDPSDIIIDPLGIDTGDTCRHFIDLDENGILLTQGYHLPRTLYMCHNNDASINGLAVNKLEILGKRGPSIMAIWTTRVERIFREATLSWSYALGLYDLISSEAEMIEAGD